MNRTRWAAVGAAVAVSLGAGGVGLIEATSPNGAAAFVPITPCRLFDTRPEFQVGPRNAPLGPNDTHSVAGSGAVGDCMIPSDASGLVLNVTTVGATAPTFITVWPSGEQRPIASHLNPAPGQPPTPNAVTTDLGSDHNFSIYNAEGAVHVFADVVGYYTDHHHDDRYYTEVETDAAIEATVALSKFISLDVYADPGLNFNTPPYAGLGDAGLGGINLDVDFNFTLPPDYTTGSPVQLRMLGYARDSTAFPCNGELAENFVYATRADVGRIGTGPRMVPNQILNVFTQPDVPRLYVFEILPEATLQAGDAVSFGLFNLGPATRCEVVLTGAAVHYA